MNPTERVRRWWARRRAAGHAAGARLVDVGPAPLAARLDFAVIDGVNDLARIAYEDQQRFERSLLEAAAGAGGAGFEIPGYCGVCESVARFGFDWDGGEPPNWRESLYCSGCGLISRWRAAIELFRRIEQSGARSDRTIYLTERLTLLYAWFATRYPDSVGSEFVDPDAAPGEQRRVHGVDIRHEDLTALSFADGTLSWVLSFDVLEHVPDYRRALREIFRVLEPGGRALLSAPFVMHAPTTEALARVGADGTIEHLAPPQYHRDPIHELGALCYHSFGWDLLSELGRIGFERPRLRVYWDPARGYLGFGQPLITAERPA